MHDTFQDQSSLFIVLEYLPGGELIKHIRKQMCLSLADARFYLAEIILAVETLHTKGIIYRDLKPENILLDVGGHIKLIDFGFAKILRSPHDRTFTNCGTPGYCAPEVMLPRVGHTYKADIWSIGILICEMLGGFTPFQRQGESCNPNLIMERCRNGELSLPKNLNPVSRDLIKLLLVADPDQRLEIPMIKMHPFFRGINWTLLSRREVEPPFVPRPRSGGSFTLEESESQSDIVEPNKQGEVVDFWSKARAGTGGTGASLHLHKPRTAAAVFADF